MAVLRTAYVNVLPQIDSFDGELKRRLRSIDASTAGRRIGAGIGDGMAKGLVERGTAFTKAAAAVTARMSLLGAAAANAAPGVAQLGAALAPAAGALVALPAALAAVKAASATFKVATAGVGEAITAGFTGTAEQAKKALEDLPPAAARFARSIITLKPQVDALKASVAQRFFLPLQDDIAKTAQLYLPLLTRSMSDLAGPLGGLGEQFTQTARKADVYRGVQSLFYNTGNAVVRLRTGVDAAGTAFGAFLRATSQLLPGIADALSRAAVNAGAFVTQAAKSGQIVQVFRNAQATLRELGAIAGNVGSILGSVFGAASVQSGGLLGNLRQLTGQAAAFFKSATGSSALTGVFSTLATLGQALRTALAAVLPAVAQSLNALLPAVGGLAPAVAQLVVAVAPLLPYFAQIAATVITKLTPAVAALAGWLTRNHDALKALVITVGVYVALQKAAAVALAAHSAILAVQAAGGLAAYLRGTRLVIAATRLWGGVQAALNLVMRANPIGLVITAVAALIAVVVLAYQRNETFRKVVQTAWAAIKSAIKSVGDWFVGTLYPSLKRAFEQLVAVGRFLLQVQMTVWRSIFTVINTSWGFIRDKVFNPMKTFITKTIPDAFRSGVNFVSAAWAKMKDAAKAPVRFVIETVINRGIIGTFNKVADFLGVKDRINQVALPRGFAAGGYFSGRLPGAPSSVDNMLAAGPGGPIALASGEYVVNARSTRRHLPLLEALNEDRRFAAGGLLDMLSGPAGWVRDRLAGPIGEIAKRFGSNPMTAMLAGMATKARDLLSDKVIGMTGLGGLADLGRGLGGALRGFVSGLAPKMAGAVGLIRGAFGFNPISGLRPGAVTVTGNRSYHALGRATDWPASMQLFEFMRNVWGKVAKEIIYSPAGERQIHNGREHMYTGAVRRTHFDHVHLALAQGGRVGSRSLLPFGSYDTGGYLPPGLSIAHNGTGRPEPVGHGLGEVHLHLTNHGVIGSQREMDEWLIGSVSRLRRQRRIGL